MIEGEYSQKLYTGVLKFDANLPWQTTMFAQTWASSLTRNKPYSPDTKISGSFPTMAIATFIFYTKCVACTRGKCRVFNISHNGSLTRYKMLLGYIVAAYIARCQAEFKYRFQIGETGGKPDMGYTGQVK